MDVAGSQPDKVLPLTMIDFDRAEIAAGLKWRRHASGLVWWWHASCNRLPSTKFEPAPAVKLEVWFGSLGP